MKPLLLVVHFRIIGFRDFEGQERGKTEREMIFVLA
jgi:hypothetical protein